MMLLLPSVDAFAQGGIAFTNATVVSVADGSLERGTTVLVEGDRIRTIGPSASIVVPDGFAIIDAANKFLMPGLAEMHGHVPDARGDAVAVDETLFLYLANGITTVRGMLGWPGQDDLANLSDRAGVMYRGNWLSEAEIADRLLRIANRYAGG
ncbi:MAG: hypothetical protein R2832_18950 [Rhodothermales bacterium]